ncbi:MAG: DUF3516 domain-containing protein [Alphaproteobacteria bacterium]|nr:DUF3516 domain-containing protein [Alphaproteobacteria bacterium]
MSDDDLQSLGARIPERGLASADDALDVFLAWVADRGLSLYPAQEEAILELYADRHVVLETPTGSGKSLVAAALHFRELAAGRRSVYTAPIKALVSEKFFDLCRTFGAESVGLMTGDGSVNRDAPLICCTAEVLANMALREGEDTPFDAVVMDEFHYYGDRDRGMAWQIPLLTMPQARFLLMSATLGDMTAIIDDLTERGGRPVAHVSRAERPVPLHFVYADSPLQDTVLRLVRDGRAPLYVVHFTQSAAGETAGALMSVDFTPKEDKRALRDATRGVRFDSPYGPTLLRFIHHGVGLHHAGLLPRYRLLVEKLAQQGLLRVICGTDTLGVGINVPIRTALFTQLCKFDGEKVDILTARDFKQIAGRAGRKGFDEEGLVVAQAPEWVIENQRRADAAASGRGSKRKFRKKSPPTRGYKHWDEQTFRQLIERPPEPLVSRFQVSHGLLLSLLQRADEVGGDGLDALHRLIEASHSTARDKAEMAERAETLLEELVSAGVVDRDEVGGGPDGVVVHEVSEDLQQDFSLHHALSLFLLHAVEQLDAEAPEYALRVLTLVESILESPKVILYAQERVLKGQLMAALKAEGVPYEERIEALEQVSWPKPMADWIYATFNEYRETHPWVAAEDIRPKSIARDMIEQYASFSDYVKDLGIQRAEGVLLRYLTQVYQTVTRTVPADARTPELIDAMAYLRATLARVDESLVGEWERLLAGKAEGVEPDVPVLIDISRDRKSFNARLRAELHAVVRALAVEDWAEAIAGLRHREPPVPGRPQWSPDDLAAALAPYIEEYGRVTFDHAARMAWNTRVTPDGPLVWRVQQLLVDANDDNAWSIDGVVDLRGDTNPEGPLVELIAVGE